MPPYGLKLHVTAGHFRLVRESVVAPGALGRVDLDAMQADLTDAEELMATGKYLEAVARYETVWPMYRR